MRTSTTLAPPSLGCSLRPALLLSAALFASPAGCGPDGGGEALLPIGAHSSALTTPGDFLLRTATGCVDVDGASDAEGRPILQWYCSGAANQRFRATGTAGAQERPEVDDVVSLIAAHSDKCMAIQGRSLLPGAAVVQASCDGSDAQRFAIVAAGDRYRLRAQHSGLCLSVQSASYGAGLVQADCAAASTFDFRSLLRAPVLSIGKAGTPDWCLDIKAKDRAPGAAAIFYPCNGQTNQQFASWTVAGLDLDWAPGEATMLVAQHSGKCLAVRGASRDSGALVEQQLCTGADHQIWERQRGESSAEIFRARHSGLCLTSDGANNAIQAACPSPGAPGMPLYRISPLITSVSGIGSATLSIAGAAFASAGTVTVGGQSCAVQSWSSTAIRCTMLPGASGLIVVTSSLGYSTALDRPVVAGLTPGVVKAPGPLTLKLTGKRFDFSPRVTVGTLNCPVTSASPTEIRCTVATLPDGTYPVSLSNRGYVVPAGDLSVAVSPRIDTVIPDALTRDQVWLTLRGQNFGSSPKVSVGGSPCAVSSASDTQISCVASAPLNSAVDVVVANGGSSSSPALLQLPPWLDALSPDTVTTTTAMLTITGRRLGVAPVVMVGTASCAVLDARETQLTCMLTAPASGSYEVRVSRAGQSSDALNLTIALP